LDTSGEPVKGAVVRVEANIEPDDGPPVTLRKEQRERTVKGQLRGYETLCWVDDVPRRKGEYDRFVAGLLGGDTFRLLSDVRAFCALHWTDRRKVLLELAGAVGPPPGFDALLVKMAGRSADDYERMLRAERKRLDDERREINPRIDELLRGLPAEPMDEPQAEKGREAVRKTMAELEQRRRALLEQEQQRQARIDELNDLRARRTQRESELRADMGACQELLDEQARLHEQLAQKKAEHAEADRAALEMEAVLNERRYALAEARRALDDARCRVKELDEPASERCPTCGRKWPASRLKAQTEKAQAEKVQAVEQAERCRAEVERLQAEVDAGNKDLRTARERAAAAAREADVLGKAAAVRLAEIEQAIRARPTPDPSKDASWQDLTRAIEVRERELGAPVTEQLRQIEDCLGRARAELDELNRALAQRDRAERDRRRIGELEARERELARQVTEVDGLLAELGRLRQAEAQRVERAVNAKFDRVTFRLFNRLLNGGIEPTCEAMLDGVPYPDLSHGQQIVAGIDIINTLAAHYGRRAPLFIDHYESLTARPRTDSQVIGLRAVAGLKTLTIRQEVRNGEDGIDDNQEGAAERQGGAAVR